MRLNIESNMLDSAQRLKNFSIQLPNEVDISMQKIMNVIQTRAHAKAPVFTGQLRAGIKVIKKGKSNYEIQNLVPYSGYQEYGYTPHSVSTKHPKVFAWAVEKGIFDRNGNVPRKLFVKKFTPHVRPAIEETRKELNSYVKSGIRKAWMKRK
jgi:hypothetical protein